MGAKYTPAHAGTRGIFVAAMAIALALSASAQAATIPVDDFALPNPADFYTVGTGLTFTHQVAGPIGGQRNGNYVVASPVLPNSVLGLVGRDTSFNINAYQLGAINDGPTVATLRYAGLNNIGLGNGEGVDLTSGGTNDRIQIQFYTLDAGDPMFGGLQMAVTLTTGGSTSTVTELKGTVQGAFNVDFPLSSFGSGVQVDDVDTIQVVFNGTNVPNIDFEVRGIVVVPEPSALAMMTLGGAFFAAAFARRSFRNGLRSA